MQYEGEHKVIALRGIERAREDGVVEAGAMEEVVGMIQRNGSMRVYAPHTVELPWIGDDIKIIRIHKTSDGDNVVYADVNGVVFWLRKSLYDSGNASDIRVLSKESDAIYRIEFMGNYLIMESSVGILYYIFKDGDYERRDSGVSIAEKLPSVSFKVDAGIWDGEKMWGSYRASDYNDSAGAFNEWHINEIDDIMQNKDGISEQLMKAVGEARYKGSFTGYFLVGYAYHLKNATSERRYVQAGPLLLMGAPERYRNEPSKFMGKLGNEFSVNNYIVDGRDIFADNLIADLTSLLIVANNFRSLSTDDYKSGLQEETECKVVDVGNVDVGNGVYKYDNVRLPYLWLTRQLDFRRKRGQYWVLDDAYCVGNTLSYRIEQDIDESMRDVYDKLCIFVSEMIDPYMSLSEQQGQNIEIKSRVNEERDYMWFQSNGLNGGAIATFTPRMKSLKSIAEEISKIESVYKVIDIPFDDIHAGDWIRWKANDGQLVAGNLSSSEVDMLPVSSFGLSSRTTEGHIYVYNRRLHLYNNRTVKRLRVDYGNILYWGGDGQDAELAYKPTMADIAKERVMRDLEYIIVVKTHSGSVSVHKIDGRYNMLLNGLLTIPESEVDELRIIKRAHRGDLPYRGEVRYEHPKQMYGNMLSYVLTDDLGPLNIEMTLCSDEDYESLPQEITSSDDLINLGNQLKYFSANSIDESNQDQIIGNGEIIGLAKFGLKLSQDNFGRHPLLAFCTDGIWALGIDTESGGYSSCSPLNKMVCVNKNSICEIDSGVVFATEMGLVLLSDNGVEFMSALLNGGVRNKPRNDVEYGSGLKLYRNAVNHGSLTEMEDKISKEDFRDYVTDENCHVSYLQQMNMLLCYNRYKPYSYVIELSSMIATKLGVRIRMSDENTPSPRYYSERDGIEMGVSCTGVFGVNVNFKHRKIVHGSASKDWYLYDIWKSSSEGVHVLTSTDQAGWWRRMTPDGRHLKRPIEIDREIIDWYGRWHEDYTIRVRIRSAWRFVNEESGDELGWEMFGKLMQDVEYVEAEEGEVGRIKRIVIGEDYTGGGDLVAYGIDEDGEESVLFGCEGIYDLYGIDPVTWSGEWIYKKVAVSAELEEDAGPIRFDLRYTVDRNKLRESICSQREIELVAESESDAALTAVKFNLLKKKLSDYGVEVNEIVDGDRFVLGMRGVERAMEFSWEGDVKNVESLIASRSISVSEQLLKTSYRVVVRGCFRSILDDSRRVGLYVLGSIDGEHWQVVGAKEKRLTGDGFHDIGCETYRVSVRYIMVILTGSLSTDSHIDGLEITAAGKYENKLK